MKSAEMGSCLNFYRSLDGLCWGLTATRHPLRVILCRLPEKGRKKLAVEIKEKDREERGTGMKVKKQRK